jgi:hypothetical protein
MKSLTLFVLAIQSPVAVATAAERPAPCAVAIVGATVIDGNGGTPMSDATVIVRDGKFTQLGKRLDVKVPDCAQVIDGAGTFVTPGFVDTNVHMAMPGSAIEYARYWDRLTEVAIEGAQLELKYGVTSVRDSYGTMMPLLSPATRSNPAPPSARDSTGRGTSSAGVAPSRRRCAGGPPNRITRNGSTIRSRRERAS